MRFWELCQSLHLSMNMNIKDAVGIKWKTFGFLIMLVTVVEYLYFFFWKWARICHYWFYFCKKCCRQCRGEPNMYWLFKIEYYCFFFFLSCSFLFISLRLFCCALKCLSQHISDETIKCRCWHSIRGKGWVKDGLCWTLSHCIHLGGDAIYICTLNAFPDLFSKP